MRRLTFTLSFWGEINIVSVTCSGHIDRYLLHARHAPSIASSYIEY